MVLRYNLDLPIDKVWHRLKKVGTLHYIADPVVEFKAINPPAFPDEWIPGNYETSLTLLGWIPFGRHHIVIQIPDAVDYDKKVLVDNGYGALIKTWKHTITLRKESDSRTVYQDEVLIRAGVLTPFVWTFAMFFYRWRRRKWFKLIKSR